MDFESQDLKFPLECHFRIIAEKTENMHFVIETVLLEMDVRSPLQRQNESQGGKYQSFSVNVVVDSLERMREIDGALRGILGVKMVL